MIKMPLEVRLPDFNDGEAGDMDAVVSFWAVEVGASLQEGDDLLEIVTDKASFVVPCPRAGVLLEKRAREDDRIRVNDVIAVLEVSA